MTIINELQTAITDAAAELADAAAEIADRYAGNDAETLEIRLMVGDPVDKLVAIAKRRSAPMTSIAAIRDKLDNMGRAVSSADAHACAQSVGAFYQSAVHDMVYLIDCVSALRDAIADAASDLTDIADSLAMRYGKLETDRSIIRKSIAEAVDALVGAEREAVEPEAESRR
jgi:hypothetical protein|nr:MAG TPA: hypothetical protein [Caudoviricetes sp.]